MKITGYSTALFSTWIFIEDYALLFDAGEGLTSSLLQKSRKIKNVFISHADRDHLTGLLQFNQLNAREGYPIIHYPADCSSFPYLEDFFKKFDPHVKGTIWKPIKEKQEHFIKDNLLVQTIRNNHVKADAVITKSLSFKLFETKRKLKSEFLNLKGLEIKNIIDEKGKDFVSETVQTNILGYSGDTPVEDYARWDQTKILIHEATFLDNSENTNTRSNKHSNLKEVIEMAANIQLEKLILNHFSSRYSKEEIDQSIRDLCKVYNIKIPVYRIPPGEVVRDILSQPAINE